MERGLETTLVCRVQSKSRAAEEEWMRLLGHCWFFIGRGEDGWHGMGVGLVLTKRSGRSCFLFPEKALLVACLSVISPPWALGLGVIYAGEKEKLSGDFQLER